MTFERILIVDDNQDSASLTAEILFRELGLGFRTVTSAREALHLTQSGACFDVIVSDYEMPEMNGAQFFNQLQKNGVRSYFVLYSGRIAIAPAEFSGPYFAGFISKPDFKGLIEIVVGIFTDFTRA